jgi:hypothetical protein
MTLTEKLKEAGMRASSLTLASDRIRVSIYLRNYGYMVEGVVEMDDAEGTLMRTSKALSWEDVELAHHNPLLAVVESVADELGSPPKPTKE